MGTKRNPADNDCYVRALPDEPMFVLLARDKSAPGMVSTWCQVRLAEMGAGLRSIEDNMPVIREAQRCAGAMEAWRIEHGERNGVPAWKRPNASTFDSEYMNEARSLLAIALRERAPATSEGIAEFGSALTVIESNAVQALAFLLEHCDFGTNGVSDGQYAAKI